MKIYRRNRWDPSLGRGSFDHTDKKEIFIHWTVTDGDELDEYKDQVRHMQYIEDIARSRGWAGIPYNYLVFQPVEKLKQSRTYEGRGINYIPAGQENHNAGTLAIAVVMKPGDKLRLRTKWELVRICRYCKRKHKTIVFIRPHSHVTATQCPGDLLRGLLPWLRKRTGLRG